MRRVYFKITKYTNDDMHLNGTHLSKGEIEKMLKSRWYSEDGGWSWYSEYEIFPESNEEPWIFNYTTILTPIEQ